MKVHWFQHAPHEELGCIAPWLAARGASVSRTDFAAGGLPPAADFDWLIVMGGPMNVYEYDRHPWLRPEREAIRAALDAGKRVLGICLGAQLIADVLGGRVVRNPETEIGWFDVHLTAAGRSSAIFGEGPDAFTAFHWHGDTFAIPPGFQCLGSSEGCVNQAFGSRDGRLVALQFHPEVTAADARTWLEHEPPAPSRYVQTAEEILGRRDCFAVNNRQMVHVLERMAAA